MRRPEWQSYRGELAQQLKQEPDRIKRQAMLDDARATEEYQKAEAQAQEERQRYYAFIEHLAVESVDPATAEKQAEIIKGATDLATLIIDKFPQRDADGSLRYYLVGSLSVMLLSQAESMADTSIEGTEQGTRTVPDAARNVLEKFARPIGDIDFVRLKPFRGYGQDMGKGGGSIFVKELTPSMRQAITPTGREEALFTDPVDSSYTAPRAVRIQVEGRDFYIADPRDVLAVKIEHIAQNFAHQPDKALKFTQDFSLLLEAVIAMGYTREELLNHTRRTLLSSMPKSPECSNVPYHHALFGGEVAKFFDEVVASAGDADYLKQIPWARDRGIGILKVLGHFESAEHKQKIIDLLRANRTQIDQWQAATSNTNRQRLAQSLYNNESLRADFATKANIAEPSIAVFDESLKTHVWAFRDYADRVPDEALPDRFPVASDTLKTLMVIGPNNLDAEIDLISHVLQKFGDRQLFSIHCIFERNILCPKYGRDYLVGFLIKAIDKIEGAKRWQDFMWSLQKCLVEEVVTGEDEVLRGRLDANQREQLIKKICADFGIEPL